jgi:Tfp pilus assembly protein PilF
MRGGTTRLAPRALALVLGVLHLAGCQCGPHPVVAGGSLLAGDEPSRPLDARQIADIHVAEGQMLASRGDLEHAEAAYLEAVKRDSSRADAWTRLAVLADRQGNSIQAAEYYRKAKAAGGDTPALYCNRGYSCYLQKRWNEAEVNLRQAITLEPADRRAHNNLGLVLAHTGRADEALAEFHRAGCSEAEAQANLALCLAVEGSWAEARVHYQQALTADSSSAEARRGLAAVGHLQARAAKAPEESPGPQPVSWVPAHVDHTSTQTAHPGD